MSSFALNFLAVLLGWPCFISSSTLGMSSHCVLAPIFPHEATCWSHWSSFDVMNRFSFAVFKIVSLSLTFSVFTMMCLCVDLLAFILLGIFWNFRYVALCFHQIWTLVSRYFFKYFSAPFSPFSVCDPRCA